MEAGRRLAEASVEHRSGSPDVPSPGSGSGRMEVEPAADAEMPELEEEDDDHMLERLALAQQEEEYVAFLRRDAMFTGERFDEVHASDDSKETVPLSFRLVS